MHLSTDPIDPQNQEAYAWDQLADFSAADGQ
jgi:hypothetical protein